jgi:glycine dehydrogenase subunit 1
MRYVPNTSADRREMLATIGRESVHALFSDIPMAVRERFRSLDLAPRSELEVFARLAEMAAANVASSLVPFLGGGVYDHYIPSVVSHIVSRSEFSTAYTPYQPEVSQGTLTAMFEFQTMISELTGMEVANASMYDGATALAEAALMAERIRGCKRIAVVRTLFPHVRRVLETYAWASGVSLLELPYDPSGRCDFNDLPDELSALIVQTPNAFGVIESLNGLKERIGDALLIVSTYPLSLGLLEPPGAFGADIVVGEGQSLGLPMAYGGPMLGLFATRKAYLRQMPGRVAGQTVDAEGNVGYVMAAQTREQHIRRGRATSNICTNSALCALAATVYLASVGGNGLRGVAELNLEKAHALAERITKLDRFELAFDGPFFNEFVVRTTEDPATVGGRLADAGFLVAQPADLVTLGVERGLRIAVTEKRTQHEIDRFVAALGGSE